jgi:hypothetical protein
MRIIMWILKAWPPFLFPCGILDISNAKLYIVIFERIVPTSIPLFKFSNYGKDVMYLFADFFLFILIIMIYENWNWFKKLCSFRKNISLNINTEIMDTDVS